MAKILETSKDKRDVELNKTINSKILLTSYESEFCPRRIGGRNRPNLYEELDANGE